MLGIVNRAIECFLSDTYGAAWADIAQALNLGTPSFEALLPYDDALTGRLIAEAERRIGKPREELLEDLGIYLVSHPRYAALRRLLRFAGVTFEDFLLSVDEIPDRTRLALADLHLPTVRVHAMGEDSFAIWCGPGLPGFAQVLAGCLRAMADDYGALVTLSLIPEVESGAGRIDVTLHTVRHSDGRAFKLAVPSHEPARRPRNRCTRAPDADAPRRRWGRHHPRRRPDARTDAGARPVARRGVLRRLRHAETARRDRHFEPRGIRGGPGAA
jgi:hypothetical protein